MKSATALTALVLGVGFIATALDPHVAGAQEALKIDDIVKIEFPKNGYSYTREEAVKGIKLGYTIRVERDCPEVIALPSAPSFQQPPGPSGLYPHEQISGNGQLYCESDFGLGAPPKEVARKLEKGVFQHAIEWDGRNWTGPSDTGNPKGKPFPAGTYDVIVMVHGKAGKAATSYAITEKTKLILR